jgi:hypothetical protein
MYFAPVLVFVGKTFRVLQKWTEGAAIVGDLAPQVTLLSSMKDDSLNTYPLPLKVETR